MDEETSEHEKTKSILEGFVDYLKRISEIFPYIGTVKGKRKGLPSGFPSYIIGGKPSVSYYIILDLPTIDLGKLDRNALQQALKYVEMRDLESLKKLNIYSDLYVTKVPTKKARVVMGIPRVIPIFSPDFPGYAIFWIDKSTKIEDFSYIEGEPEEKIIGILASKLLYYIFFLDHKDDWERVENRRNSFRLFRNGFIIYRLKDDPSYRKAIWELLSKLPAEAVMDNPTKLEISVPVVYEEVETLPIIKELQEKYGGEIEIIPADKAEELLKEELGISE